MRMLTDNSFINYMIELTTGVVLLMSSLYGSGQANAQISQAPAPVSQEATSTSQSSFTDTKVIEAYVRAQFASEPLLVDIARCESTFRQFDTSGQVIRGRVNHADVGVMQINEKYHADEAVKMGYNIYTVEGNVAFGKYLYDKYGSDPWSSSSPCWGSEIAQK
jgi:hypothetical protein